MSESVLPMFSSRSFIVSGLTFTSLTHFEFIFVYSIRKCSSFILLQVLLQFHSFTSFPAPLVKEVVFFPLYILAFFVKDKLSIGSWMAQRQKYRSIEQYRKPRDNLCYPYVILCKSTNLSWEVFNHSVCDFNFLISVLISGLFIFLFVPCLVQGDCIFLIICPFLPGCPFS